MSETEPSTSALPETAASEHVHCPHFQAGRCRSCGWIERAYSEQLQSKQEHCRDALATYTHIDWQAPQISALSGFRNKAKLVVTGTAEQPVLGIVDHQYQGIELTDCLLYPPGLQQAFEPLRAFVGRANLTPYAIAERRGELKFLLLTIAPGSDLLMLRFVLRSREALPRIIKHLPELRQALPALRVVSVNLQPRHAAVLEGEEEILLSDEAMLPMRLNDCELQLQAGGFFQTNSQVAAALYQTAREWVQPLQPHSVLDLYCGVGGFALHLAAPERHVRGIEISAAAIAAARSAARANRLNIDFDCGDATSTDAALAESDLIVVNPPRRGLGPALCKTLRAASARWLLYSSCNPDSLARDIAAIGVMQPRRAKLFDMFPHTAHSEVLVLLDRHGDSP